MSRIHVVWQNFTDLSSHASTTLDDRSITPCDVIDDVDMEMRAPYIPMSGEEDNIFGMASVTPLVDDVESSTAVAASCVK